MQLEPYPHLVIRNALDDDLFTKLYHELPPAEIILDGKAKKDTWYDFPACRVIGNEHITPIWQAFFRYHTSQDFFQELISLFGEHIRTLHPNLEQSMNKALEQATVKMRPGGRSNPLASGADASTECQFYVNYTEKQRAIRGSHVDRPSELFAALLYLRDPLDDSTGGDLNINRAINPQELYPSRSSIKVDTLPMELNDKRIESVSTAHYEANTLVLFLNSHKSIHAVSPRSATQIPRRHINFCCDLNFDLFEVEHSRRQAIKQRLAVTPILWRFADWL